VLVPRLQALAQDAAKVLPADSPRGELLAHLGGQLEVVCKAYAQLHAQYPDVDSTAFRPQKASGEGEAINVQENASAGAAEMLTASGEPEEVVCNYANPVNKDRPVTPTRRIMVGSPEKEQAPMTPAASGTGKLHTTNPAPELANTQSVDYGATLPDPPVTPTRRIVVGSTHKKQTPLAVLEVATTRVSGGQDVSVLAAAEEELGGTRQQDLGVASDAAAAGAAAAAAATPAATDTVPATDSAETPVPTPGTEDRPETPATEYQRSEGASPKLPMPGMPRAKKFGTTTPESSPRPVTPVKSLGNSRNQSLAALLREAQQQAGQLEANSATGTASEASVPNSAVTSGRRSKSGASLTAATEECMGAAGAAGAHSGNRRSDKVGAPLRPSLVPRPLGQALAPRIQRWDSEPSLTGAPFSLKPPPGQKPSPGHRLPSNATAQGSGIRAVQRARQEGSR